MNKQLLALAALSVAAGVASAQSSVTIYGKLDLGVGKALGTNTKTMMDASGSRLGFRGTEDLGGGLSTVFGFEHRFDPDTGATQAPFWKGYSMVGLKGGFGQVSLGRQYNPAFSIVQNNVDPFGGDTVGETRSNLLLGTGKVRVNDSVLYRYSGGGFDVGASYGVEEGSDAAGDLADRAYALAGSYKTGALWVGLSYENPGDSDDSLVTGGASYDFGVLTLSGGISDGRNAADAKVRGYLIGVDVPLGGGNLLAAYSRARVDGETTSSKFGIGYRYALSKRTKLYADFGHDNKKFTEHKSGYDVGIIHTF